MKWTQEAEDAIRKVPFFVRKRVRARVEKEAREHDRPVISIAEVKATQKRYLSNMSSQIRGYQLDTCFGPNGCPNRANTADGLMGSIESLMEKENLLEFLKESVDGDLKFHHEFRITLADCPNACSQPQIKDVGIIGAGLPVITDEACSQCEACVDACKEGAVILSPGSEGPLIDFQKCLACGQCVRACPTGTIGDGRKGFRVLLGGKLGRHPQLAKELPGIYSSETVLDIVKSCIRFYKANSRNGERFGKLLTSTAFDAVVENFRSFRL